MVKATCDYCDGQIPYEYILDGHVNRTKLFCSAECARQWVKQGRD